MAKEVKLYPMVANRDVVVSSVRGHTIAFKKDVPQHVPKALHEQCLAVGILFEDGDDADAHEPANEVTNQDEQIKEAMMSILLANDPDTYTASSMPKLDVLSERAGVTVDAATRARLWKEVKAEAEV